MNRTAIRGFAAGITLAAAVTAGVWYGTGQGDKPDQQINPQKLNVPEAKAFLAKQGYSITKEDTLNPEAEKKPAQDTNRKKIDSSGARSYKLTIKSGMNADAIASQLSKNGIIESQQPFIDYLDKQDLNGRIQVGTFVVTKDMSVQQIAKTITK